MPQQPAALAALRRPGIKYDYTLEQLQEYVKCADDPVYFIKNYVKIITMDKGLVPFELYDFQEEMIRSYHENRFNITLTARQSGKSTTVISYFLWCILFNTNYSVCISANKQKVAVDLLGRLKTAYEHLPIFLQQGVVQWARLEIEVENGSRCFAAATSGSAVRGGSYNCLAGDTGIRLFVEGNTVDVSLEQLWLAYDAASSKPAWSNNGYQHYVWDDTIDLNVFTEQIYSMVLVDHSTPTTYSGHSNGEHEHTQTPRYSKMRGGSSQGRASHTDDSRTCDCSSIVGADGRPPRPSTETCDCVRDAVGEVWLDGEPDVVWSGTQGIPTHTRIQGQAQQSRYGQVSGAQAQYGNQTQDVDGTNGEEENRRTREQDQSQPRKDCQDGSQASRYDTDPRTAQAYGPSGWYPSMEFGSVDVRGISGQNVVGQEGEAKLETGDDADARWDVATKGITIWTHKGWRTFHGIRRSLADTITLVLSNGTSIRCTENHEFYVSGIKTQAKYLRGQYLAPGVYVVQIAVGRTEWVYDPLEIEETHAFIVTTCGGADVIASQCLLLDEYAFVPPNIAEEFYSSTYPTISSGSETKIIMVSTPKGMNHFHEFWVNSKAGRNDFVPIFVHWSQVPGRDEAWKQMTIRNIGGQDIFDQEYECAFSASSYTLLKSTFINSMVHEEPIFEDDMGQYREYVAPVHPDPRHPENNRTYLMLVDTATGQNKDDSAFIIFDVTTLPYKMCATYVNGEVSPMAYPAVLRRYAERWFNPWIMVEAQDVGRDVGLILHSEFEYEFLLTTEQQVKAGQKLTFGLNDRRHPGLRMSPGAKRRGAAVAKALIETQQLNVPDLRVIQQLATYVQKGSTYGAELGNHDDLVTPLVILGWLNLQPNFAELTEQRVIDAVSRALKTVDLPAPVTLETSEDDEAAPLPPGILGQSHGDDFDDDDSLWLLRN